MLIFLIYAESAVSDPAACMQMEECVEIQEELGVVGGRRCGVWAGSAGRKFSDQRLIGHRMLITTMSSSARGVAMGMKGCGNKYSSARGMAMGMKGCGNKYSSARGVAMGMKGCGNGYEGVWEWV